MLSASLNKTLLFCSRQVLLEIAVDIISLMLDQKLFKHACLEHNLRRDQICSRQVLMQISMGVCVMLDQKLFKHACLEHNLRR